MPMPFLNQGKEYSCTLHCCDLDYDSRPINDTCPKVATCRCCSYQHEQDYTIVIKDERFKEFI